MITKRIGTQILAILIALFILTSATVSMAMVGQDPIGKEKKEKKAEFVPDELIVKYKGDKNHKLEKLAKGTDIETAIKQYKNRKDVEYAEPNYIVQIMNTPNDPGFSSLWAMNNVGQTGGTPGIDIGALEAWNLTTGSDIVVAVIDTGVDYTHPDLVANIWTNPGEIDGNGIDDDGNGFVDDMHGIDTYNNDADPIDDHDHGTHVSGTICGAGNNSIGIVGVNWNCKIMAVKFLNSSGSGTTDGAIRAIDYAIRNHAKVMSNSWGGGGYSQLLNNKIQEAINSGIVFVAAAGNSGSNNDVSPNYPSNYPGVIAVAAIDHNGNLASWSSYGANTVHLAAPGVNINSTVRNGGYAIFSGTSMATPHVAGAAALIWSLYPTATKEEVETRLLGGIVPLASLAGKTVTGGMLNAFNSLDDNINPPPTPTPPPPLPTPVPPPPLAIGQNVVVDEDNSINVNLTGYLPGDPGSNQLTFAIASNPQNGSLQLDQGFANNGKSIYTPNLNFYGTDRFTFIVCVGSLCSEPGIVEITITPVNDRPVAMNQTITLDEDTSASFPLIGGDVEPGSLSFTITQNPTNGTLGYGVGGVTVYTPKPNFNGADSFRFTVSDYELTSPEATVKLVVTPTPEMCWNGSNQYLIYNKNDNQIRKFISCATGTYGPGTINPNMLVILKGSKGVAYNYSDSSDNNNWLVVKGTSPNRVSAVKVNGGIYPTNRDYFR